MSVAVRRGDGFPFFIVCQIVLDHLSAFLGRAVGNDFFARLKHFVQIFLPVGDKQGAYSRSLKQAQVVSIRANVAMMVQRYKGVSKHLIHLDSPGRSDMGLEEWARRQIDDSI